MIGYLKGTLISRIDSNIIVSINNIGYRARVEKAVLDQIDKGVKDIEIFTFTYVREDTLDLYGFKNEKSLALFEKLISISGIGPKIAIGIFSLGKHDEIVASIQKADTAFFTALPKLGKKNAQKIIIELKNKVGGEELSLTEDPDTEHVLSALKSFGFTQKESLEAMKKIDGQADNLQDKVKLALKSLGK